MSIIIPLSKTSKQRAGLYKAIVDDDYSELALLNWSVRVRKAPYTQYAFRVVGRKTVFLHTIVIENMIGRQLIAGELIDHINRNGLDNREENLRVATPSENQLNRNLQVNNKSGYKGVWWNKSLQKWQGRIFINGKGFYLGVFDTALEAHIAYCKKFQEVCEK